MRATREPESHACPCQGRDLGSKTVNCQVFSGVDHLEGLVGSCMLCDMCKRSDWLCCVSSTSLTIHGELNQIVVSSHHMFTLADRLT